MFRHVTVLYRYILFLSMDVYQIRKENNSLSVINHLSNQYFYYWGGGSLQVGVNGWSFIRGCLKHMVMILCLISMPLCKFVNDGDECLDLFDNFSTIFFVVFILLISLFVLTVNDVISLREDIEWWLRSVDDNFTGLLRLVLPFLLTSDTLLRASMRSSTSQEQPHLL